MLSLFFFEFAVGVRAFVIPVPFSPIVSIFNTWQFNSAKTIFAFSCPPQLGRRVKLFVSCCRPYLVHKYTILPFLNMKLPEEILHVKV